MYNNINSTSSSDTVTNGYLRQAQEGIFSSIMTNMRFLVCPISKKFLLDPLRLPCGHVFDQYAFNRWYFTYKTRICPIIACSRPYETTKGAEEDDPYRRQVAAGVQNALYQPCLELKNRINELYYRLPNSPDQPRIQQALNLFFGGQVDEAISMMVEIRRTSIIAQSLLFILDFMKEHAHDVSIKINQLIQDANLPAVGIRRPQAVETKESPGRKEFKDPEKGRKRLRFMPPYQIEPKPKRVRMEEKKVEEKDSHSSSTINVQESESVLIAEIVRVSGDEQSITSEEEYDVSNSENRDEKQAEIRRAIAKTQTMNLINAIKKRSTHFQSFQWIGDPNKIRDEDGQSLLHLLTIYYNLPKRFVEKFMEMGIDINIQNSNNETALHLAARYGKANMVRYLIELGISKDIKNKEGKSALDVAVDSNTRKAFD